MLEFGINDSNQVIEQNTTIYSGPMQQMVNLLRAKVPNVIIIISSPIPIPTVTGSWLDNGDFRLRYFSGSTDYDWARLARDTAAQLQMLYVDHANAVGDAYRRLGRDQVLSYYKDGLHTNATGSYLVAQAFVRALKCSNAATAIRLNADGQRLERFCSQYGVLPPL